MQKRVDFFLNNIINKNHFSLMNVLDDDIKIEFPYHFPNTVKEIQGKENAKSFFENFNSFIILEQVELKHAYQVIDNDTIIIEYLGMGKSVQTGMTYHQKYFTILTYQNDLIKHWKDYWNPIEVVTSCAEDFVRDALSQSSLFLTSK